MHSLIARTVLVGALLGMPTAALAADRCDPAVQAERTRVFDQLAQRGIRVAGVTGAGGHAEFSGSDDARRYTCDPPVAQARTAGVTGAGGVTTG
jgi:hypothetical protein